MRDENNKNIKMKGEGWSISATAINVPSCDVAITVKIAGKWTQSEVAEEGKRIEGVVDEWFLDSKLDPNHFIREVVVPVAYKHGKHSMQLMVYINCLTRKQIQMGKKNGDGFESIFQGELDRLKVCLELA